MYLPKRDELSLRTVLAFPNAATSEARRIFMKKKKKKKTSETSEQI